MDPLNLRLHMVQSPDIIEYIKKVEKPLLTPLHPFMLGPEDYIIELNSMEIHNSNNLYKHLNPLSSKLLKQDS